MRETVLRALFELDRWERRQRDLRAELSRASDAPSALAPRSSRDVRAELEKVNRQVAHYRALTQDMKKQSRPARVSDLLRTLFQP